MKPIQVEGLVRKTRVSPGSKSDRVAVVLATNEGQFILHQKGGDSYTGQAALSPLLGKRILAFGSVANRHFFLERYEILDAQKG
jgi:hypothetical protein